MRVSLIILLVVSICAAALPLRAAERYPLATGDRVSIAVLGQADLGGDFTLDETGRINLPLAGEITLAGMSPVEAQAAVETAFGRGILSHPRVSLRIAELRPLFILGDVRSAGAVPFRFGMTVMTAIAAAGGVGPSASSLPVSSADLLTAEQALADAAWTLTVLRFAETRISAQIAGEAQITPPSVPAEIAPARRTELAAEAQAALIEDQRADAAEIARLDSLLPRLDAQIAATKEQMTVQRDALAGAEARMSNYSQLAKAGLAVTAEQFEIQRVQAQYQGEIAKLSSELAALDVAHGELENRISDAQQNQHRRLLEALRETQAKRGGAEITFEGAQRMLMLRRDQLAATDMDTLNRARITLTRSEGDTPRSIRATPLTLLMPGDTLDVRLAMKDTHLASEERP